MKKYRLLRQHFIANALMDAGTVIERDDNFVPSQFMAEIKDAPPAEPEPEQQPEPKPVAEAAPQTGEKTG